MLLVLLALLAVWVGSGVRRMAPGKQLAVLDGALLAGRAARVEGSWALAPPGLLRLSTYPLGEAEVALPDADAAGLRAADGARFGLQGWATLAVRPSEWKRLHASAAGDGLRGVLLSAVRAAGGALAERSGRERLTVPARRRFGERLAEELTARGADLRDLRLDAISYVAEEGGVGAELGADTNLLVIGLDGADWKILDALFEQGRLPNLRGLVERGSRARLRSISPLLSPVVWTSMATGVEPTRHGILDFLVQDDSGARQPVTSAQREVPTVWEMLSRAGVEVGVVGWWASWPADPVRGYLVADRVSYQLFGYRSDPADSRGKTWPPDLYDDIRPSIVEPAAIEWEVVRQYLTGDRLQEQEFDEAERGLIDEFRTLIASGESYVDIAMGLREQFRPRMEVVYLEGTDTVGHLFMPYRPPLLPGVPEARAKSFAEVVDRYYDTADRYVGRLLSGREEWTVLVVSDHGFATDSTRPQTTDSRIGHGAAADWHRRFGVLILSGPEIRGGRRIEEATVYDVAPTILALFGQPVPQSWPGRVLAEAFTEEFVDRHPVTYRKDDPEREWRSSGVVDPAAADLISKLRSLGYVGGEGGAGDSRTAHNNAGVSMLAQGRYEEAEREFREGLGDEGETPMLLVNLGLTLRLQGRLEEARPLLGRALQFRGTRRIAGNQLAQLLKETGDLDGAESLAREILLEEPDASAVRNTLGLVLEARGDLAAAEEEYRQSAELDPDSALARNNLGNLGKMRGDLETAEQWYLRAIEADPYFMGSYNNLALVYQSLGEIDRAIDLYDRALVKAPGNAIVLNNLGSLYFATGEGERAREAWRQAAEADAAYPSPLNNLAGLEITLGELETAEEWIGRALALDPGYGDARINLSNILRARGETSRARDELVRATEDPDSAATAWKQLGLLDLAEGRTAEATAGLARALEISPRDRDLLNALGEALRRQGRTERTVALWRRSLELDPRQAALRRELARLEQAAEGP